MAGLAHAVEQGAGGDGLDGFAQTHFVGQQAAFGKGEVKHAFALVGKEGHGGFLYGPFAALHLEFVFAAQLPAFDGVAALFEPRLDFLRQADLRAEVLQYARNNGIAVVLRRSLLQDLRSLLLPNQPASMEQLRALAAARTRATV